MPRPRKWRKVCSLPDRSEFGPMHADANAPSSPIIYMTVEEYETVRLIDLEELTQESCAAQMNVARTTVQRIYRDARKKIAESLVLGKTLTIGGGDFRLCDGAGSGCYKKSCHRHG
jgi:predicted DNA-binding protein (UPF0251 family)